MDALERLIDSGFAFRSFPAYPRHLGVVKYQCAALLEPSQEGRWKQFSSAGFLLESGEIALLVERRGEPTFVCKTKEIPAAGEPIENYRRFLAELEAILEQQ